MVTGAGLAALSHAVRAVVGGKAGDLVAEAADVLDGVGVSDDGGGASIELLAQRGDDL
ncbi:hypothetical protein ACIG0C_36640 [Kitasatospora aureofaciens]|uniref:hypothetical protein n=1 Tax=Kitasatospora aureofaciens TaxID=1894 RepID=UPI0012FECB99|nr:hypothetical protein [Kitasatospora aureofaciens]